MEKRSVVDMMTTIVFASFSFVTYDKGTDEKAVTWKYEVGIVHHSVDDGESAIFWTKSTSILTDDTEYNLSKVMTLYQNLAANRSEIFTSLFGTS